MISKRKRKLQKELFGFSGKKTLTKRVGKIERRIRQSQELQLAQFDQTATALNATPTVTHINMASKPEGRKAKMLFYEIKGVFKQNLASAVIDNYRLDLVLDKNPNKLAQTPLNNYGSATPTVEVLRNILNSEQRVRIIRSISGSLSSSEGSASFRHFHWRVKLGMVSVSSVDGNFTATNLLKNNISLIFWTTATANQPTIQFESILKFDE